MENKDLKTKYLRNKEKRSIEDCLKEKHASDRKFLIGTFLLSAAITTIVIVNDDYKLKKEEEFRNKYALTTEEKARFNSLYINWTGSALPSYSNKNIQDTTQNQYIFLPAYRK